MRPRLRAFLRQVLPEIGGLIVYVSVTLLSVSVYFGQQRDDRWIALGLLLILLGVAILAQINQWWAQRVWLRHVFILIQAALIAALMLLPDSLGFYAILFFVLCAEVPMLFSQRVWLAYVAAFALLTAVVFVITDGASGLLQALIYAGGYYFFASFSVITARALESQKQSERLLQELQAAHRQLEDYAGRVEELAVADERNRLAREMHDTLGHRLTVAAVQLEGAQRLIGRDPERASRMVGTVHEQVTEALAELRHTVATLRAPVEAGLSLPKAVQRLVTGFQEATGIAVDVEMADAVAALPEAYRHVLYRGVQEGLTNVQRHAGASHVWVRIAPADGSVVLEVSDNGAGAPPEEASRGFGLAGLKERAAQFGGSAGLAPRAGGGASLTVRLPLPQEDEL